MAIPNPYFLLKTENTEPLASIITHVTNQLHTNEQKIQRLSEFVDTQLKSLPKSLLSPSTISYLKEVAIENGHEAVDDDFVESSVKVNLADPLRYHLESKYSVKPLAENTDSTAAQRIASLQSDISQLKQIQKAKLLSNSQLYEILQEYENSILFVILPLLRDRLGEFSKLLSSDKMKRAVDWRFEGLDGVYKLYLRNVEMLLRLVGAFKVLLGYIDDDDFGGVYHQFVVLGELVDNLKLNQAKFEPTERPVERAESTEN